jgi:hypothetical protein
MGEKQLFYLLLFYSLVLSFTSYSVDLFILLLNPLNVLDVRKYFTYWKTPLEIKFLQFELAGSTVIKKNWLKQEFKLALFNCFNKFWKLATSNKQQNS